MTAPEPRAPTRRPSGPHGGSRARVALAAIATLAAALAAPSLAAQDMGTVRPTGQLGGSFEQWSFGCCTDSAGATSVKSASEWSVPLAAVVTLPHGITLDAWAAWMHATVALRDPAAPALTLSGFTDAKLRASIPVAGNALLATVGVNVPTGKTALGAEELSVLRVVGAPELRFAVPALGTGWGGTAGLVYATRLGEGWSWGVGASYEYRGRYSPAQAAAVGLGTGDVYLRPGQAVRVSLGTDGLVGSSAMAVSLSTTFYGRDRVTMQSALPAPQAVQLGPMFTAEWRLRAASPLFRELSVWAFDRYRTKYRRGGEAVDGTSGNELELGAQGLVPLRPGLSLVTAVRGRHHTGLSIDNTIPTAAILSGGLDVGISWDAGALTLRPTVGGQIGRMNTGGRSLGVHALDAALTITPR